LLMPAAPFVAGQQHKPFVIAYTKWSMCSVGRGLFDE
jgi:hypothetical protein